MVYINADTYLGQKKKLPFKMTLAMEWIDEKINDRTIEYFEYKKFSNIVEIDRGAFSKVSKAKSH